ncbi:hypothetical protein BGW37DRAFT_66887 [Umbelopsis sp. PMI_123]|nr:hypothetical protein BGW37DRAFT_66887 [Umbelopsis sp. PMI_123]
MYKSGSPIQTTGQNLVGLWRPSFTRVHNKLYIFGGGGQVTTDLHVLDLVDMRWSTVQTKGTPPKKRYGHTAVLWRHHIIIFGGCKETQDYCNDVHVFDVQKNTWISPDIRGDLPAARYLHSAAVYDNKMFVYGGFAKNPECTYVLDELSILDLETFTWSNRHAIPPRYNHSCTLIGHKMYIFGGKDEHGNTVSDLFTINLNTPSYTPHHVLGPHSLSGNSMVLLKSQHFCEALCGKLLVFGRYLTGETTNNGNSSSCNAKSVYGLWMLDLDTLEWSKQECNAYFDVGGWNYFTVIDEPVGGYHSPSAMLMDGEDDQSQASTKNLLFLGNTDPFRPQGYDHFRDALMINSECLGLYDIPPPQYSLEFAQLLNDPELSDFVIEPADGPEIHVHQVILMARWPHFRNIHKSGMIEATQRHLQIPEPHAVVLALLRYFYSDCLDDAEPWEIVADVLVLANMYILTRLKKICCERLYRRHLTVETCGHIFERAIFAQEPGLKALVLEFMFANYGAVLKSNVLVTMSPQAKDEFLEAVPQEAVLEVSKGRAAAAVHVAAQATSNHSQTSSPAASAENTAAAQAAAAAAANASSNPSASSGGFVTMSRNVTGGSLSMSGGGMDLSGMNGMSVGV